MTKSSRRAVLAGIAGLSCAFQAAPTSAQPAWPARPIRLIIPYPPGGNSDLIGRLIAARLTETLGQPVVADNRGGGGGTIGAAEAARQDGDGYTLLLGDIATHAIGPALNPAVGYRAVEDFVPVARLTSVSLTLVVSASSPHRDLAAFLAAARTQPVTYASAGIGTPQHLAFEYLRNAAGIQADHVPYRGSAPALTDILGGRIDAMIDGTAVPQIRAGALRALAVTGDAHAPALPDVPTMSEAGVPGYLFASWHALFAPRGTPDQIVARINTEVNRALSDPAIRQRLADLNIQTAPGSPADLGRFLAEEAGKMARLIESSGARPE